MKRLLLLLSLLSFSVFAEDVVDLAQISQQLTSIQDALVRTKGPKTPFLQTITEYVSDLRTLTINRLAIGLDRLNSGQSFVYRSIDGTIHETLFTTEGVSYINENIVLLADLFNENCRVIQDQFSATTNTLNHIDQEFQEALDGIFGLNGLLDVLITFNEDFLYFVDDANQYFSLVIALLEQANGHLYSIDNRFGNYVSYITERLSGNGASFKIYADEAIPVVLPGGLQADLNFDWQPFFDWSDSIGLSYYYSRFRSYSVEPSLNFKSYYDNAPGADRADYQANEDTTELTGNFFTDISRLIILRTKQAADDNTLLYRIALSLTPTNSTLQEEKQTVLEVQEDRQTFLDSLSFNPVYNSSAVSVIDSAPSSLSVASSQLPLNLNIQIPHLSLLGGEYGGGTVSADLQKFSTFLYAVHYLILFLYWGVVFILAFLFLKFTHKCFWFILKLTFKMTAPK